MSRVELVATKLQNVNKKGILKPDSDGYYTLPIGGLNTFNSAGEYYVLDGARELFANSGVLQRRIKAGNLHGELGHPSPQGLTNEQYLNRLRQIDEKNISTHFRRIWIDEEFGKKNPHLKNPALAGIMAELRPSGAMADQLQRALDNPHENVNFSIRAMTRNYFQAGRLNRVLAVVYTWDQVHEPGIATANKWDSPVLEDIHKTAVTQDMIAMLKQNANTAFATEDSKILALETVKVWTSIGELPRLENPLYCNW